MKISYDIYAHEHEFEPAPGLPERLPAGERLLWQGSPDWRTLAVEAFHVRKLAVYFAVILALRATFVVADGGSANDATRALLMLLPLALAALGIAFGLAWLSARTTVYSITDKRVVMRIGMVLGLSFNLPLGRIANAGLRSGPGGVGNIPLALAGTDSIAFLHLWPHARPWRVAKPEPMLRCVPDADTVAQLLARAWSQANGRAAVLAPAVPIASAAASKVTGLTGLGLPQLTHPT